MRFPLAALSVLLVALAASPHSWAQQASVPALADIRLAFERHDYESVTRQAERAFEAYDAFAPAELAELHVLLGRVAYARAEEDVARRHFRLALALDPPLALDPLLVSPKIIALFEAVRVDAQALAAPAVARPTPEVRYVVVPDGRPAAAMRSMLVPGWGQLHKGQRRRGLLLLGTWTAASGGTLWAHLRRADAQDRYLGEDDAEPVTDPAVVEARYDRFSDWHRRRGALALAAGAVWAYAYLDALLGTPRASRTLSVEPGTTALLSLRLRF